MWNHLYDFLYFLFFLGVFLSFSLHYLWLRMDMKFLGMSIGVQVIVWFVVLAIATFSEHLRNPLLSDRVIRLFMFFLGIGTGIGLVAVLI